MHLLIFYSVIFVFQFVLFSLWDSSSSDPDFDLDPRDSSDPEEVEDDPAAAGATFLLLVLDDLDLRDLFEAADEAVAEASEDPSLPPAALEAREARELRLTNTRPSSSLPGPEIL